MLVNTTERLAILFAPLDRHPLFTLCGSGTISAIFHAVVHQLTGPVEESHLTSIENTYASVLAAHSGERSVKENKEGEGKKRRRNRRRMKNKRRKYRKSCKTRKESNRIKRKLIKCKTIEHTRKGLIYLSSLLVDI